MNKNQMRKILTFKELFEAKREFDTSWMPSKEEMFSAPLFSSLHKHLLGDIGIQQNDRTYLTDLEIGKSSKFFYLRNDPGTYKIIPDSDGTVSVKYGKKIFLRGAPFRTPADYDAVLIQALINRLAEDEDNAATGQFNYAELRDKMADGDWAWFLERCKRRVDMWTAPPRPVNATIVTYISIAIILATESPEFSDEHKDEFCESLVSYVLDKLAARGESQINYLSYMLREIFKPYLVDLPGVMAGAIDAIREGGHSILLKIMVDKFPEMWKIVKPQLGRGTDDVERLADLGF